MIPVASSAALSAAPALLRTLEAQRDQHLEGTAELHFVIERDGHISYAATSGTLTDQTVFDCLSHEVGTWAFPAVIDGGDGVQVNYPLTFKPAS